MRAVALLILGALVACAPTRPPSGQPSGEEMRAYTDAMGAAASDPQLGASLFRAFLEHYPRSSFADDAVLRLAALEQQLGRPRDAAPALQRVIADHPTGNRTDSARLVLARLERDAGELEAAWVVANDIRFSLLGDDERREAHALLAELAAGRGDRALELFWLTRVRSEAPDAEEERRIEERIDGLLREMAPDDLEAAARELERRAPAGQLWLLAAERHLEAGDLDRARAALVEASLLPLPGPESDRLETFQAALGVKPEAELAYRLPPGFSEADPPPRIEGAEGVLGVVLPLHAPRPLDIVAEESLNGILLAAGIFGSRHPRLDVEVEVRDSLGSPDRAAEAVRALALDPVTAVVGPFSRAEAEAAALEAEEQGVPLLTLTNDPSVAGRRPHVFRLGLTRRAEAEALAEYAVEALGLRRFAILYPRDAYGRDLEALFWGAVERRGGRVVAAAGYEPGATDFAESIRRLVGFVLLTPDERAALEERRDMLRRAKRLPPEEAAALREEARALLGPDDQQLPPIVDFEALFIPDSHESVKLIAPQLAYHEIQGVRLLGSSGWNDPDLVRIAGQHVEGAVFAAAFDPASPVPQVAEFARRFRDTFDAEPSVFAAQAFDAATLALAELARGHREPEDIREDLLGVRAFPGVSGVTAFLPDGNAVKRPFLLGVERGRIVNLEDRAPPALLKSP